MTEDKIFELATEAGLTNNDHHCRIWSATDEQLQRFTEKIIAQSRSDWKDAVIDELVCAHILNYEHEHNPRKAIHDAISWNVEVALDPAVSSDARALIELGQRTA